MTDPSLPYHSATPIDGKAARKLTSTLGRVRTRLLKAVADEPTEHYPGETAQDFEAAWRRIAAESHTGPAAREEIARLNDALRARAIQVDRLEDAASGWRVAATVGWIVVGAFIALMLAGLPR